MADELEFPVTVPPWLHLVCAYLAMEPSDTLISFARDCGGGSITERVQRFIWNHCINRTDTEIHAPYLKSFLKKLIGEIESNCGVVLDELYEKYAFYMTSLREKEVARGSSKVLRRISFIFPEEHYGLSSCPKSGRLEIPLQCSLNMLEGDTGCSIWPSSLFLSEFILSFPELFSNKSCVEVGSGVGLVGICLAHVKPSKVTLTDGDPSTLANMKQNLELNLLRNTQNLSDNNLNPDMIQCRYLPWDSAREDELLALTPAMVLGADVIYDPLCIPHLVRILTILLGRKSSKTQRCNGNTEGSQCEQQNINTGRHILSSPCDDDDDEANALSNNEQSPVAYIAQVIRNIDTFDYFLSQVEEQQNLHVELVSGKMKSHMFLPYLRSYDRSKIKLFRITSRELHLP